MWTVKGTSQSSPAVMRPASVSLSMSMLSMISSSGTSGNMRLTAVTIFFHGCSVFSFSFSVFADLVFFFLFWTFLELSSKIEGCFTDELVINSFVAHWIRHLDIWWRSLSSVAFPSLDPFKGILCEMVAAHSIVCCKIFGCSFPSHCRLLFAICSLLERYGLLDTALIWMVSYNWTRTFVALLLGNLVKIYKKNCFDSCS